MAPDEDDAVLQTSMSGLELVGEAAAPRAAQANHHGHNVQNPWKYVNRGATTHDITQQFRDATATLKTGELVRDGDFSLFDSVGALEIMDPKMDTGVLGPGETLEDDYDVTRRLRPEEVLGIMDGLLATEVAWHQGYPLSLTLFTSLYVDHLLWPEPGTLEDASFARGSKDSRADPLVHVVLKAYCLGLIKACDLVHRLICAETWYEEEDFVTNLFNRSLLNRFSADDICVLLEHALTTVNMATDEITMDVRDGLLSRLKYRTAFLRAVMAEPRTATAGSDDYWKTCIDSLSTIERTHASGQAVHEAFSAKTQRRLASTVPPRPIIRLEFPICLKFLRQLFTNALEAAGVLNCYRISSVINFLQIFFAQKPQPAVFIRCLVQAMMFDGLRSPKTEIRREWFFHDLEELVLPGHILTSRSNAEVEAPQDAKFKIWQQMSRFVEQVCEPFYDVLRALCMNRSRARRMLCNWLAEWDGLQLDLEDLDNELRAYTGEQPVFTDMWELPLSSWSYFYKLRQMQWIVQLGFELQMYHSDEWPGMYLYLREVAEHRHKHIERIYGFLHHHRTNTPRMPSTAIADLDHSLAFLTVAAEEASATAAQAESFACLYQALAVLGLLPSPPPRPYGTPELRQALRLRPFLPLCLPILTSASAPFDAIDRLAASLPIPAAQRAAPRKQQQALALLDAADVASRRARKSWDAVSKADAAEAGCVGCEASWRAGVKEILRAAVIAGIAMARVRKWILVGAPAGGIQVKVHQGTLDEEMPGGLAAAWMVPQIGP